MSGLPDPVSPSADLLRRYKWVLLEHRDRLVHAVSQLPAAAYTPPARPLIKVMSPETWSLQEPQISISSGSPELDVALENIARLFQQVELLQERVG